MCNGPPCPPGADLPCALCPLPVWMWAWLWLTNLLQCQRGLMISRRHNFSVEHHHYLLDCCLMCGSIVQAALHTRAYLSVSSFLIGILTTHLAWNSEQRRSALQKEKSGSVSYWILVWRSLLLLILKIMFIKTDKLVSCFLHLNTLVKPRHSYLKEPLDCAWLTGSLFGVFWVDFTILFDNKIRGYVT